MNAVLDVGCLICRVCKVETRSIKRCVKCHRAYYCSRECQIEDWPTHRSSCQQHLLRTTSAETNGVAFDETGNADCCVLKLEQIGEISGYTACKYMPCEIVDNAMISVARFKQANQVRAEYNAADNSGDVISDNYVDEGCGTCIGEILTKTKTENSEALRTRSAQDMAVHCPLQTTQNKEQLVSTRHDKTVGAPVDSDVFQITVRCGSDSLLVPLRRPWSSEEMLRRISSAVKIVPEKLRLISSGKQITVDNLLWAVSQSKPLFLAIGEKAEDEDGLDPGDIDVIIKQLKVERNVAIRALKQTTDVVDAILLIANK